MSRVLMIVESPNKAKKIRGYYPGYEIIPTIGHFKDLPTNEMGVEPPEHKPKYEVMEGKQSVIKKIREAAKQADVIYVATDPDREGEAIAAHVVNSLGKEYRQKIARITYSEISKKAIDEAIVKKRNVDWKLVSAQELRRVLDRYVGYMVSPELSRKLKSSEGKKESFTAGRVQSIALRLVVERDYERLHFVGTEHYGVELHLEHKSIRFVAKWKPDLQSDELMTNKALAFQVKERTSKVQLTSSDSKPKTVHAPKPLITSSFIKLMSRMFRITSRTAMDAAQKLFEQGLITYHRTDSHEMSSDFMYAVRDFANRNKLPLPEIPHTHKAKEGAQQGHECLRVTDINLINARMVGVDDSVMENAYRLIWKFSLESQLAHGINRESVYTFANVAKDIFIARASTIVDLGWRSAAARFLEEEFEEINEQVMENGVQHYLPVMQNGEVIEVKRSEVSTKNTEPPKPFTESTLVEKMESLGVGRPSTFAQILENLVDRQYVLRENKTLKITSTPVGNAVIHELKPKFSFLQYDYTAKLEADIDRVASGTVDYLSVVTSAYEALAAEITIFREGVRLSQLGVPSSAQFKITSGSECPQCNKGTVALLTFDNNSKNKGKQFFGCSSFPACRFFQWVH